MKKIIIIIFVLFIAGIAVFIFQNDADVEMVNSSVINYTSNKFELCNKDNITVSDIKTTLTNRGTAHMICNCGFDCSYTCDFEIHKIENEWSVVDKEYKCIVS